MNVIRVGAVPVVNVQTNHENGKKMKRQSAFTLIEILVVISITGLLVTMGIVSYNEFNRRQILDQAAKTVLNDLRDAQSKASSGNKGITAECAITDTLVGWKFEILSMVNPAQYRIYGVCGAKPIFGSKTVTLPGSLTITGATIIFKPLSLGIDSDTAITITGYSTKTRTINVTKTGTIDVN